MEYYDSLLKNSALGGSLLFAGVLACSSCGAGQTIACIDKSKIRDGTFGSCLGIAFWRHGKLIEVDYSLGLWDANLSSILRCSSF